MTNARATPYIIWTDRKIGRGASDSHWVAIGGTDEAAIGKKNDPGNGRAFVIFNELICYRIAKGLGLPIPDSFVHKPGTDAPFFAQLNFKGGRDFPPSINPDKLVQDFPSLSARIVAFDILIFNTDRHPGNLARLSSPDGPDDVYVFDHDQALLGVGGSAGLKRLETGRSLLGCDGSVGHRQCLLDRLSCDSDLRDATEEIEALPDDVIRQAVQEACSHGLDDGIGRTVAEELLARRSDISSLVARHRAAFKNIGQWGLFDPPKE